MKKIMVSDIALKVVEQQDLSLTFRERLAIAQKLDAVGVDAIELPAVVDSKEKEVICRTIASEINNAVVKIPVGDTEQNFNFAVECVKYAKKPCLQVVLPVSTALMEYGYHLKAPAMLNKITELTQKAVNICEFVEFVALDAFRAEQGFIEECAKRAVQAGAQVITVCDDNGNAFPEDYMAMVEKIKAVTNVKVFVQPSDNLNMATACAISAIKAGADGVKTSDFGKYLSLSVISDVVRAKKFELDFDCGIDFTKANSISCAINDIEQEHSFETEEKSFNEYINGDASYKDVATAVKQLGYELSDVDVGKVYEEFKKLSAKKEIIEIKELEAVVASTAMQVPSTYHLVSYVVNSSNIIPATANIILEKDGEKITGVSTGDGPIDAAFHAIEQVIGHHYELDDFQVHAVTKGRGAVGSSIIRLRAEGKLYPGNGVSTDIVGACIRAYINALNKIVYEEN